MYPFFAFADKRDPYNYQLTMLGSSAIWASELLSSFVARQVRLVSFLFLYLLTSQAASALTVALLHQICLYLLDVDVTNLGLDEMRSYPELVTSVMWTSIHVLMDMLLFLIVCLRTGQSTFAARPSDNCSSPSRYRRSSTSTRADHAYPSPHSVLALGRSTSTSACFHYIPTRLFLST
jgi:hypothetical protein